MYGESVFFLTQIRKSKIMYEFFENMSNYTLYNVFFNMSNKHNSMYKHKKTLSGM